MATATTTELEDPTLAELPKGLAYRAVIEQGGLRYYSERLTRQQAAAVLRNQPRGLKCVEGTRTRNGLLNGEALFWEQI